MLLSLCVSNFAIVEEIKLHWKSGFTSITGETGAGKSISIDALMFCLGARADVRMLRSDNQSANVTAVFDISNNSVAKLILSSIGLNEDDECEIRRSLNNQGRTKCFINGHMVKMADLKQLGKQLVSIHGQHAHQLLINTQHQRQLIDKYANNKTLLDSIKNNYNKIKELNATLSILQLTENERENRKQLLSYQVDELDVFSPQELEYESLDVEQYKLANANTLIKDSQSASEILSESDNDNILSLLNSVKKIISSLAEKDPTAESMLLSIESAFIDLDEVSRELRNYSTSIELDPQRLQIVEGRLTDYLSLSRKHGVKPALLHETHHMLSSELIEIESKGDAIKNVSICIDEVSKTLLEECRLLHGTRVSSAKSLSKEVEILMGKLSMKNAIFDINITGFPNNIREHGFDDIEIMVSTNPGQSPGPIGKIASGGELSRISLAVQVIMAEKFITPTLIFDEVDVGISGGTAAIVGKMIKGLGDTSQVISITHLPQVASFAHHHYVVEKSHNKNNTSTVMRSLNHIERVNEIARLVGGEIISKESIKNAEKLISEGASV